MRLQWRLAPRSEPRDHCVCWLASIITMGTLMVRCPRTGQDFSSGIKTDRLSFELMPAFNATIRCPLAASITTGRRWMPGCEGELARSSSNDAITEGTSPA
jgi:hypothetical protein